MIRSREVDPIYGELFLAGETVPRGNYCQINGRRVVTLNATGLLPASLDGRVACYRRTNTISSGAMQMRDGSNSEHQQR